MKEDQQIAHDRMAQRTVEALGKMLEALGSEFSREQANRSLALGAMCTGNLAQAAEFWLNANLLAGVSIPEAKRELDQAVADYWQQAVKRHFSAVSKVTGETVQ